MSFRANWPGRCADCDEGIAPGDNVEYVDDVLVHVDCSEVERPADPLPDVCGVCWMAKSVTGACAC